MSTFILSIYSINYFLEEPYIINNNITELATKQQVLIRLILFSIKFINLYIDNNKKQSV